MAQQPAHKQNLSKTAAAAEQTRVRLIIIFGIFMLGFLAVGLRLIDLTLLQGTETQATAAEAPIGAKLRGKITDRNGELIATSLKMASVYADTTLIDDAAIIAGQLAKILPEQNVKKLQEKLSSGKKFIWLARNITPRQEYAINALGHPGLAFRHEPRRIYPHANLTAHLTGYTDIDGHGLAGVEKQFDQQLSAGEEDLRLTIDLRIQHLLHRELQKSVKKFKAQAGVGMVMDVNTGDIIAMVSLPDFDPHYPGESPEKSRFNRASHGVFEMGSTIKLFATAGALDSGTVDFGTQYETDKPLKFGRFKISDYHAKNRAMTVPEIFIYSSNIGTAKMALAMGEGGLKDFYSKLGFFDSAPLELPERGKPLYPKRWRDVNTATASFGHGIAISPVQLVRATAALVNGGHLVDTHITLKDPAKTFEPPKTAARVISAGTSQQIRQLLELVVVGGTGRKAAVDGYHVGGKTGTAEKLSGGKEGYSRNRVLSSFLGVFPINSPKYAVLAMLDEPQAAADTFGYATGGWTAAPVVAEVIAQMGPLYQIAPDYDSDRDILHDMRGYLKEHKEGKSLATIGTDR